MRCYICKRFVNQNTAQSIQIAKDEVVYFCAPKEDRDCKGKYHDICKELEEEYKSSEALRELMRFKI